MRRKPALWIVCVWRLPSGEFEQVWQGEAGGAIAATAQARLAHPELAKIRLLAKRATFDPVAEPPGSR